MKKFILAIIITLTIPFHASAFYSDVDQDHQYFDEIKTLYDLGKLEDSDKFEPDEILTKGETYKIIINYNNTPLSTRITFPYKDIRHSDPLAPYIQTAIDHRIIKALSQNSKLGPEFNAKKQFVLQTMFKSLGIGVNYFFDQESFPFSDLSEKSYLAPVAKRAAELGILETKTPTKFKAFKDVTKGEAAFYLHQIHEYDPADPSTIVVEKIITNTEKKNREDLATFLHAWDTIHNNYLYKGEIDKQDLEFGAIKGFIDRLDDVYTTFEEPTEAEAFLTSLTNELEGIGIMMELIDDKIVVIAPIKQAPAEKIGIKANDEIIKVNQEDVRGQTLQAVAQKIQGAAGTEVEVTIKRGNTTIDYKIIRTAIKVSTVESEILKKGSKNIAYISVITFGKNTFTEFKEAIDEMETQAPSGYIIDLRNNPGGYLNTVINMISLFTKEKGSALKVRFHNNEIEGLEMPDIEAPLEGKKIVILVNEGSASSSEIMAGALQDFEISTIIGTQTFGKGTAQELTEYTNGGLLKHTVAEWLTPNGRIINDNGITPDIIVENTLEKDKQLEAALKEF